MTGQIGASGMPVVERTDLRRGLIYVMGRMLVVGTMPPTPIQQIVMDGVAAAHPWFRDPMRADPMAVLRSCVSESRHAVTADRQISHS